MFLGSLSRERFRTVQNGSELYACVLLVGTPPERLRTVQGMLLQSPVNGSERFSTVHSMLLAIPPERFRTVHIALLQSLVNGSERFLDVPGKLEPRTVQNGSERF